MYNFELKNCLQLILMYVFFFFLLKYRFIVFYYFICKTTIDNK